MNCPDFKGEQRHLELHTLSSLYGEALVPRRKNFEGFRDVRVT